MIAYTQGRRLWVRDLAQVEPRELPGTENGERPFWSPDSKVIGYFVLDGSGGGTLRTVAVQGGSSTPVCTLPPGFPRGGTWNPSGEIVFGMTTTIDFDRSGALFTVSAQGGTPRVFLQPDSTRGEISFIYPQFLPDGQSLVYAVFGPKTNDLWVLPLTGKRTPVPLVQTPFNDRWPTISPDGRYVAYESNESGRFEVYVVPFPKGAGKLPVSVNGGFGAKWSRQGNELFYVEGNTLMVVPVETKSGFQAGTPQKLFTGESVRAALDVRGYDVSADGPRFVVAQTVEEGKAVPPVMTVVQNWAGEFRK